MKTLVWKKVTSWASREELQYLINYYYLQNKFGYQTQVYYCKNETACVLFQDIHTKCGINELLEDKINSVESICSPEKKDIKQQSTQTNSKAPPAQKIAVFSNVGNTRDGRLIKKMEKIDLLRRELIKVPHRGSVHEATLSVELIREAINYSKGGWL